MAWLTYFVFINKDVDDVIYIFPEQISNECDIVSGPWRQRLKDGTLLINDVERTMVPSKFKNLNKFLKRVKVKREKIIEDIQPSVLEDYGLDGSAELQFNDQRFRWSILGNSGYIWDENRKRIYVLGKRYVEGLGRYTGRLDNNTLISNAGSYVTLEFDGLVLERVSQLGGWLSSNQPHRPPFNSRGADLIKCLSSLTLDELKGVALQADAEELWKFVAKTSAGDDYHITVYQGKERQLIKAGNQPMQVLSKQKWQELEMLRDAFKRDYLLDIMFGIDGLPFDRIIIKNGALEEFRLQRYKDDDSSYQVTGYSYWELIWPEGRESASSMVGYDFFNTLNNLEVKDVRLQPISGSLLPRDDMRTIECYDGEKDQRAVLHWFADGTVQSLFHRGKLVASTVEQNPVSFKALLNPSSFLNPYVLPADVRRVEKIQRIHYQKPYRGELLKRQSLNSWFISYYSSPETLDRDEQADATSCSRVALSLLHLQSQETRLATPERIKLHTKPQRGLDIRLSAWQIEDGEDEQFIEETLGRDWGMSLIQENGQWWAMNRESTLEYKLDERDVEQLFSDVSPGFIFAGVPGQIEQLRIKNNGKTFMVVKTEQHWQTKYNGQWQDVDKLQMRLFLSDLSDCKAQRSDSTQQSLPADQVKAELEIFMPSFDDRREHIRILIGEKLNGLYPVSVDSSSGQQVLDGVAWCPAASIEKLLRDQRWFLPADIDQAAE